MSELSRVALFGHPVGHSRSAVFQNAGFRALHLPWEYSAQDLGSLREFEEAVEALRRGVWRGANVTLPYKIDAVRCVDHVDQSASAVGAVNTLVCAGEDVIGYNTDVGGFVRSALELAPASRWSGQSVRVFGAGGAARAVVCGLDRLGVEQIEVINRTRGRAKDLVDTLQGSVHATLCAVGWGEVETKSVFAWVQCTSLAVGARVGDVSYEHAQRVWRSLCDHAEVEVALDIVYGSVRGQTPFLDALRGTFGGDVAYGDGLGMLLYQGTESFALWTGHEAPEDVMRSALERSVYVG